MVDQRTTQTDERITRIITKMAYAHKSLFIRNLLHYQSYDTSTNLIKNYVYTYRSITSVLLFPTILTNCIKKLSKEFLECL